MLTQFLIVFVVLILAELVKGLSANGTPPVLQRFSWQMDLAHVMWSNIGRIRIVLALGLVALLVLGEARIAMIASGVVLGALWYGIYWLFNRYWVGRFKFPAIRQMVFKTAAENAVDPSIQVIGVAHEGKAKAFPANMVHFHHQLPDEIGGQPIWVTYCGLCRAGRVYDLNLDGAPLSFTLVGAISFNAVFRDHRTGSWWHQETGECAKGPLKGRALDDFGFEQMSLSNWLAKHPDTEILQYDPAFIKPYTFINKMLKYEASVPAWHMQERPPLVLGLHVGDAARAYDLVQLQNRVVVNDSLNETPLLLVGDKASDDAFAYDRRLEDGSVLDFVAAEDGAGMTDSGTGSTWTLLGQCTDGPLAGTHLRALQSYKQYVRSWIEFHKGTDFYTF